MTNFKWFVGFVLAANIVPALPAETRCPGNVASVPFRLVNRYQMIVSVSVNHSGPYNFLLDTGTQLTMLDPGLWWIRSTEDSRHHCGRKRRKAAAASFAHLDRSKLGSHAWVNQKVLVYDLQNLQATGLKFGASSARIFSSSSTC